MAITRTLLTSGSSATDGTSFTTAAFATSANTLIEIVVEAGSNTAGVQPSSITKTGLTFVSVNGLDSYGGAYDSIARFRSMGSSSSGTATISFSNTQDYCTWHVYEFTGVDTTGTNGSGAVVQAVSDYNNTSHTTFGLTLAAFGSANNGADAAYAGYNTTAYRTGTPDTGWTENYDTGYSYFYEVTLESQWRADNDTSPGITWSGTQDVGGGTAIEIKASASGITGTSATTNAADTSTASGGIYGTGTSTQSNAADTSAASGGIYATGTSTTTNAADTSSASGTITVTGTSATTNADDTSSAAGQVDISGSSATTNAADTSTASGGIYATGTSTTTNAEDTSSADGTVSGGTVTGTIAVTNANDTSSASGTVPVTVLTGHGSRVGRKRRFRVEIGDHVFYVWSEAEAQAILDAFAVTADVPEVTRPKKTRFNVVVAEAVDQTAREIKANTKAQQKREEIEEENLLIILKALNS